MATQIGTIKADNVNVLVSEHFALTRIYQDKDNIVLADLNSLRALISKLQEAESLIVAAKKGQ